MVKSTMETLKKLGFTEYEAKAYISLVGFGMATAREIHEKSGVPQGRIYSVLKSLLDKNYIEIQEGNPSYYYAENPSAILGKLKNEINDDIDESIEYLSNLHLDSKPPSLIWMIHSEWGIKNRIKTLLQNVDKEIFLCVHDYSYFGWVYPEIKKLKKRVNLEIYAKNKADFAGTNLRVSQFSDKLLELEKNILAMPSIQLNEPEGKIFMIIDDTTGFVLGKRDGKITGTVIQIPQLTYMLKFLFKTLDEEKK